MNYSFWVMIVANKPLHPCRYPGCLNLTSDKYCDDHKQIEDINKKINNKLYDLYKRDKKIREFYNSKAWLRLREQALMRDHYLCQHCLKQNRIAHAEIVDHIVPIKVDWSLRLSLSNTQSLCKACHNRKSMEDKGKYPQLQG